MQGVKFPDKHHINLIQWTLTAVHVSSLRSLVLYDEIPLMVSTTAAKAGDINNGGHQGWTPRGGGQSTMITMEVGGPRKVITIILNYDSNMVFTVLKRFSIECRKTKTKVREVMVKTTILEQDPPNHKIVGGVCLHPPCLTSKDSVLIA